MAGQASMPQQPLKKISLTKGFADAINLPRHSGSDGDYPLYPHGSDSKVLMQRSQNWFKAAEGTYNSPSNVRVVCLSGDGANVLYWTPMVKGGKLTTQVDAACDYVFDKSGKAGVKQYINPQIYSWDNAGLQALVNPVVLSNIEELWLSVDVLACPRYAQYYELLRGLQPGQVSGASFLKDILESEISTASKPRTISDTFPLLRAIVLVQTPPNVKDFHKCALRTDEIKKILEAKYPGQRRVVGESPDIMSQLAKLTGFGFAVCPIATGDILKFSLGDYKYDQRVLSDYKARLAEKYTPKVVATPSISIASQPSVPVVEKPVEPVIFDLEGAHVTSELETFLNKAVAEGKSASKLNLILSAYSAEYGSEYLKAEYLKFTASGKAQYSALFKAYM